MKEEKRSKLYHTPGPLAKECGIIVSAAGHYYQYADKELFYREGMMGYQLFYTVTGRGWIDYCGKTYIIKPETITCIDLAAKHGMGAYKDLHWEHYWIYINGNTFTHLYNMLFKNNTNYNMVANESVKKHFEHVYKNMKENDPLFDINTASDVLQIMGNIIQKGNITLGAVGEYKNNLVKSIYYIEENFDKAIRISDLSQMTGYSKDHYSRLFKKYTGFTPTDYIKSVRIEKAKELLCKTDYPISLISEKVGFKSQFYFIKSFRDAEDITPGKYRKLALL